MNRIFLSLALLILVLVGAPARSADIPVLANIAALNSMGAAAAQYPIVYVLGYHTAGDGGGGVFVTATGSSAGDSCVNFSATGSLHWQRLLNSVPLSVEDCGAYNNGTNTSATTTAWQAATAYVAASSVNTQKITAYGHNYSLNATIQMGCANLTGSSQGTTIQAGAVGASVETPVFEFTGSGGAECFGSISNLQISAGAHGIGCEILSASNVNCDITDFEGQQPFLFCSCSAGGFVENSLVSAHISQTSIGGFVRLAEYRTNNGGTGSFRNSGIRDETQLSYSNTIATAAVVCDAASFCYETHFGGVYTYDSGAGGTYVLLQNLANYRAFTITSGHARIEIVSNTVYFVDASHQQIYFEGTYETNSNDESSDLLLGPLILNQTWAINGSGVVQTHNATTLDTHQTFTGTAGANLVSSPLVGAVWLTFNVNIVYTNYNWAGTINIAVNTGSGACAATLTASYLIDNSAGYGAPTIGCANSAPNLTNAGWPAATMNVFYNTKAM